MNNQDNTALSLEEPSRDEEIYNKKQVLDWRVNPRTYEFMGAKFHPLDPLQTLKRAKWMTAEKPFRYIVTPNVDHIVRLTKEPEVFKPLYDAAWLSVCDSRILELLANKSDIPLKAVPGSDLTQQIFDNILSEEDDITVIGADTEIISIMKEKYAVGQIFHHEPPMGLRRNPDAVQACAEFIRQHPSRYVFICVGSPQQEMVAKAALEMDGTVGLGLCVGASLDFLAGRTKRAPKWMQRSRLEWLFRLASEPKRLWRRYLIEGPKIFQIWQKWKRQQSIKT